MPDAVSVREGETLVLECVASNSNPPPVVRWITAEEVVISGSALEIPNIQRSQAGNYICTVAADDGSTQSSSTVVTVTCKYNEAHTHFYVNT